VYNGQDFVADAIQCVLAQTVSDFELIISDNDSTDQTVSICRQFAAIDPRIRVHCNDRNLGVAPNYNRVFELSSGRYFKWITHDDLFAPTFVETCLDALQSDDRAVLTFPSFGFVDASGRRIRSQNVSDLSVTGATAALRVKRLMTLEGVGEDIYWCQYGLMRRETLQGTSLMGPYNGSDQTLLLELALKGELKQVPGELFQRREHAAASTLRTKWTTLDRASFVFAGDQRSIVFPYFRMLKEHLACLLAFRMPIRERVSCSIAVLNRFRRQWKYFVNELYYSTTEAYVHRRNLNGKDRQRKQDLSGEP
jgi:glycosyltransferase involved in cell wall biosynthesis